MGRVCDAAVSIGVVVGGKCMGKRRGHVPLGYFLVRLVFVAVVTAELPVFTSRVHLGIVLKAELKAIMNDSIAPSARLPEFYR